MQVVVTRKRVLGDTRGMLTRDSQLQVALHIPECIRLYFDAIVDPFSAPPGACLPCDLFPLPSSKERVFVRGTFAVGTGTVGWIGVTPTAASDGAFIQSTTATSVGGVSTTFSAFTNLANINCTMNRFTVAQLNGNQAGIRMVAFGLRIKYVGQLTSRSGMFQCLEEPDSLDVRGFNWNSLAAHPYTSSGRIGGEEWDCEVCHSGPITPSLLAYTFGAGYPFGGAAPILIAIQGLASDLYMYECYCHYEAIGTLVAGKTASHAESQLFAKAVETFKEVTAVRPLSPSDGQSLWQSFREKVGASLPRLITAGSAAVRMASGDIVGGGIELGRSLGGLMSSQSDTEARIFPRASNDARRIAPVELY